MRQDDALAELEICDLELQDAGDYTCVCGDQHTTASLTVNGKLNLQMTVHFFVSLKHPVAVQSIYQL